METKDKIFASKLKSARCKQGLSQEALAEELKCSLSTISRLERGTGSLRSKTFYDCLAWIEKKTKKEPKPKGKGFKVDEELYECFETGDYNRLERILEELESNTGWNLEKKRIVELYRLLWEMISLYRSVDLDFFETEETRQIGLKITELFSSTVGTISEIDEKLESGFSKELLLLINAYALTLVSVGLPYESELILIKLYAALQEIKYDSLENYKALVAVTNNLAYISLRLKKAKEAGAFLDDALKNGEHCFNKAMMLSLLSNHKEVCKCFKDKDGYNRDETAIEAILNIESLGTMEPGDLKIEKVLLVF